MVGLVRVPLTGSGKAEWDVLFLWQLQPWAVFGVHLKSLPQDSLTPSAFLDLWQDPIPTSVWVFEIEPLFILTQISQGTTVSLVLASHWSVLTVFIFKDQPVQTVLHFGLLIDN